MPKKIETPPVNRLRELRAARKLPLKDVAAAIGTSVPQISRLEIGSRDINFYWLRRVAAYYGIAPTDCFLPEDGGLSQQERRLIDTIREIPKPFQEAFWRMCDSHQHLRGMGEIVDLPKSG